MSSAFVREEDEQKLNEIAPTLNALFVYLRRENGGMTVHEVKSYYSGRHGREVYDDSKWYIILD